MWVLGGVMVEFKQTPPQLLNNYLAFNDLVNNIFRDRMPLYLFMEEYKVEKTCVYVGIAGPTVVTEKY